MKAHQCLFLFGCIAQCHVGRSAAFRNLGFEDVNGSLDPNAMSFSVPTALALPSWRIFIGDREIYETSFNSIFLSLSPYTSVYSAKTPGMVLSGRFSCGLYSGIHFPTEEWVDTAIAQTGLIPPESESMTFKTFYAGELYVLLDGESLPLKILDRTTNGAVTVLTMGADISGFAGQERELRFVSHPFPDRLEIGFAMLDDITFSNQPIPEPTGLLGVGALGGILWLRRRVRRNERRAPGKGS